MEAKYVAVKSSTNNSLFLKNLAIAVWGSETLRDKLTRGQDLLTIQGPDSKAEAGCGQAPGSQR